jgi:prolyl oligopeptidase
MGSPMHRLFRLLAYSISLSFILGQTANASDPPKAPVRDEARDYFGTVVHDPYQWMEKEDEEFQKWLSEQGDYTRNVLDRIPARASLLEKLHSLDASNDQLVRAIYCGSGWFYTKTPAGQDVPQLFARDNRGQERLLVDPKHFDRDSAHAKIDYWRPSWDCRLIAYGVSVGGAEIGTLRILNVADGSDLPESIDRTYYASPAWLPDNSGFFYARIASDAPQGDLTRNQVILHKLGADPNTEMPIVGVGFKSTIPIPVGRFLWIDIEPGSPLALLGVDAGLYNDDVAIYAAHLDEVVGANTPWRSIAAEIDHVRSFAVHGEDIFMSVARDAPMVKVVKVPFSAPDLAHAAVVVPESHAAIYDIQAASDGLYVREVEGGPSKVVRVPWETGRPEDVSLPPGTGIRPDDFTTFGSTPGVAMISQSWTRNPALLRYDPDAKMTADTGIQPPYPIDFSDIVVTETQVTASDGAAIPLSILHKRGLKLDGSHPALLDGYGAYGDVRVPSFDPLRRVWLDYDGIYAMAHVRGGGELGEPWHRAGMLATKPNTVSDFIACANFLIENKYTSPRLLAGEGRSAGGIMIGGAITSRPDLFGAALITVGMTNALRFEQIPIGPFNVGEFGTVATRDGFNMLMAIDAYHHVRDGTDYPAVLASTGLHDARVSSWQSGKMVARLQAASSSGRPELLRLDKEGGHFGGGTKAMAEETLADQYTFLLWQAGAFGFQPSP